MNEEICRSLRQALDQYLTNKKRDIKVQISKYFYCKLELTNDAPIGSDFRSEN
jgi:hypothetical protein